MDNEAVKEIVGGLLKLGDSICSSVVPPEAKKHFRNAGREALLGMIAVIDAADEKDNKNKTSREPKETKVSRTIDISE